MLNRRIYETIGIRYDDAGAMEQVVAEVKEMLVAHDDIDKGKTLMVNFVAFGASSLDFFHLLLYPHHRLGDLSRGQTGRTDQNTEDH